MLCPAGSSSHGPYWQAISHRVDIGQVKEGERIVSFPLGLLAFSRLTDKAEELVDVVHYCYQGLSLP